MQIKITVKDLKLINQLVLHKIKLQFSDQIFGYAWAIINPLVYIFSFWFFAYIGLRGGKVNGYEFIIWVVPGLLIFRHLSTILGMSSTTLQRNAALIKETSVNVKLIPLIEVLKETYIHIGVMLAMTIVYAIIGYSMTQTWDYLPTIYYLNFIYYWITMTAFGLAITYFFSAIGLMFRDTKNFISAILVPLFWITPVLFGVEYGLNPALEKAEMLLNPFYYFISGYRDTMLYGHFFFNDTTYNIYIWTVIIVLLVLSKVLWKFVYPIISDLV